jgi:hypothetical protein
MAAFDQSTAQQELSMCMCGAAQHVERVQPESRKRSRNAIGTTSSAAAAAIPDRTSM